MSQNPNTQIQVVQTPGALKTFLDRYSGEITNALPKHLNADRMIRLAMTAFSTTPKLRECTVQSILSSLVIASQMGLEVGIGGQGYLIPYRNRQKNVSICTFVPGWQGLVGLLNNTGRATAWTGVIYEGDDYTISLGSRQIVENVPGDNYGDFDKAKYVFACGKVNGSEVPVIEIWTLPRIWKHRDKYNKVGKDHYSYVHPEMYARKVVLLQVLKYMPKSIELQDALTAVHADDSSKLIQRTDDGQIIEIEPEPTDIPAEPVMQPAAATAPAKATPQPTEPAAEKPKPVEQPGRVNVEALGDDQLADKLIELCHADDITPDEFHAWAVRARYLEPADGLDKFSPAKLRTVLAGWSDVSKLIIDARK